MGERGHNIHHSDFIKRVVWVVASLFIAIMIMVPIFLLFKYSISDTASINTFGKPLPIWPYNPTFSVFTYLFEDVMFWKVVGNSFVIAFSTVLLTLFMGVPAGYVLARFKFPFKRIFIVLLISIRLFPDIASVIPVTTFFIKINMPASFISIILAHTLLSIPYVIFIASAAFEFVPRDIEEQARVMGAKRFTIFWKILVPMIFPSLVAGAIYTFLLSWDEFIFAHFLLDTSGSIQTLTLYLNQNLSYQPPQNVLAAISVCLSVPVIVFTFIVQRYMVSGVTSGAVK